MWEKTQKPYLFLHTPSGRYYLRVRLGGKEAHRESLKTTDYGTACIRLARRLAELHTGRVPRSLDAPCTLWDAVRMVQVQVESDPALKARSVSAYGDIIRSLGPAFKGTKKKGSAPVPLTSLSKLTAAEMERWWHYTASIYEPARANYQLLFVKRALKLARESGALTRDVGANLKRVPIPRTRLKLITPEQFAALVRAVRAFPAVGKAAAEWIEFVAYTGCRPEEANAVQWEHIEKNVLTIYGDATGTKNRLERRLSINASLADLLERIAARTGRRSGPVLSVQDPSTALKLGCQAIGVPALRRYDLRHYFATRCNESGVDIPTLAKWLGHQDGGRLVMKTYIHIGAAHELAAAARVRF